MYRCCKKILDEYYSDQNKYIIDIIQWKYRELGFTIRIVDFNDEYCFFEEDLLTFDNIYEIINEYKFKQNMKLFIEE